MDEVELPDLDMDVISVTLDRISGRVAVNYEGMNYLEAIGVLTVALNQVQETPFELELEDWSNDEDE